MTVLYEDVGYIYNKFNIYISNGKCTAIDVFYIFIQYSQTELAVVIFF
jgi:hypothetical protein